MKIKTSELTGAALDWAVAKCVGVPVRWSAPHQVLLVPDKAYVVWHPSTDWAQAGPIIEREEIGVKRRAPCMKGEEWEATGSITARGAGYRYAIGPTPLIAAMRCLAASKLGDEVEIPDLNSSKQTRRVRAGSPVDARHSDWVEIEPDLPIDMVEQDDPWEPWSLIVVVILLMAIWGLVYLGVMA